MTNQEKIQILEKSIRDTLNELISIQEEMNKETDLDFLYDLKFQYLRVNNILQEFKQELDLLQ